MRRRVGRVAVLAVVVGVVGCGGGAEKKGDAAGQGPAASGGGGGGGGGEGAGEGAQARGIQQADIDAAAEAFARKVAELGAKGFPQELGAPPALSVVRVRNETRYHVDNSRLEQAIVDRLLAGGQVKVIAGGAADREALAEQEDYAMATGADGGAGMSEAERATGIITAVVSSEREMSEDGRVETFTYSIRLLGAASQRVLVSSTTTVRKTE